MKRAVLYVRVSTLDQNPQTQSLDLRRLSVQRGFEIVHEYTDRISGAKAKRPALDQMMAVAHRREFDVVLVWAADRLARSVRHFLEVLDTLNHLGIEFELRQSRPLPCQVGRLYQSLRGTRRAHNRAARHALATGVRPGCSRGDVWLALEGIMR